MDGDNPVPKFTLPHNFVRSPVDTGAGGRRCSFRDLESHTNLLLIHVSSYLIVGFF